MQPRKHTRTKDRPPIDWKKPMKTIARELGISLARAYSLRASFRKVRPEDRDLNRVREVDLEADLVWLLDTIHRARRVLEASHADFGRALRKWRRQEKKSQVQLAAELWPDEIRRRNADVSRFEAGEVPTAEFTERLEDYLLKKGRESKP